MKSYKALLNSLSDDPSLRQLSNEEVEKLRAVFIEAFKDLSTCCEKHRLTVMLIGGSVIGAVRHQGFIPWQEDFLRESARNHQNIVFLGTLQPESLPSLYSRCDIGLCTYADYSTVDMPDKFYDYCAAGLAVVNSLNGEVRTHVLESGAGRQYVAGDGKSLCAEINTIIEDGIEQYKQNAYRIAEGFDFNNQMTPYLDLIERIISQKG